MLTDGSQRAGHATDGIEGRADGQWLWGTNSDVEELVEAYREE